MKNTIFCLGSLAAALGGTASAFTVEALPTQGVFYAGLSAQPCVRLKVSAAAGESITSLSFSTGKTTKSADITRAAIYTSPTAVFTPNTDNTSLKATQQLSCATAATGKMEFTGKINLSEGDNYLWLVYDIASSAKGNNKIQGQCLALTDGNGGIVTPTADGTKSAKGVASKACVYPFKYRVVPYYRPLWLDWNPKQLNATHFKNFTDIILFELAASSDGTATYQYSRDNYEKALTRFKSDRGKSASHIIAGFKGGASLEDVMADATKRNKLADGLADIVINDGLDGVDIDWEYPSSGNIAAATDWVNFAAFLGRLREKLAGTGASISMAYDTFCFPPKHVVDQVDWISSMTYDRNPGQHSTKQHAIDDVSAALNNGVPRVKMVLGLPFYSCNVETPRDWDTQCGYTGILNQCPGLTADTNTFTYRNGSKVQTHFFNGANLIKDKCKYAVQQKIGGVMVWAYDTDVPLTNSKSLAKALYAVIKQAKR